MEILLPYICKWITIILVAAVVIFLAKHGLHVIRIRYGKTEVEFEGNKEVSEEPSPRGDIERDKGENFRLFKLFLGSPGGLESFREAFCEEIKFFNETHAHRRKVTFFVERWENIPATYERPQSVINRKLVQCDCYVLVLYDRWGSPPGESDGKSFASGCEEEFSLAEILFNKKQLDKIVVYFKTIEPDKLQTPDDQLKKVLEFKSFIKRGNKLLFNEFGDVNEFKKKVHIFMAEWLEQIAPWIRPKGVQSVLDYD